MSRIVTDMSSDEDIDEKTWEKSRKSFESHASDVPTLFPTRVASAGTRRTSSIVREFRKLKKRKNTDSDDSGSGDEVKKEIPVQNLSLVRPSGGNIPKYYSIVCESVSEFKKCEHEKRCQLKFGVARAMHKSFEARKTVIIFFRVADCDGYYGVAEMVSNFNLLGIQHAQKRSRQQMNDDETPGSVLLNWIKRGILRFSATNALTNPKDEGKPVIECASGKEIDTEIAKRLLDLYKNSSDLIPLPWETRKQENVKQDKKPEQTPHKPSVLDTSIDDIDKEMESAFQRTKRVPLFNIELSVMMSVVDSITPPQRFTQENERRTAQDAVHEYPQRHISPYQQPPRPNQDLQDTTFQEQRTSSRQNFRTRESRAQDHLNHHSSKERTNYLHDEYIRENSREGHASKPDGRVDQPPSWSIHPPHSSQPNVYGHPSHRAPSDRHENRNQTHLHKNAPHANDRHHDNYRNTHYGYPKSTERHLHRQGVSENIRSEVYSDHNCQRNGHFANMHQNVPPTRDRETRPIQSRDSNRFSNHEAGVNHRTVDRTTSNPFEPRTQARSTTQDPGPILVQNTPTASIQASKSMEDPPFPKPILRKKPDLKMGKGSIRWAPELVDPRPSPPSSFHYPSHSRPSLGNQPHPSIQRANAHVGHFAIRSTPPSTSTFRTEQQPLGPRHNPYSRPMTSVVSSDETEPIQDLHAQEADDYLFDAPELSADTDVTVESDNQDDELILLGKPRIAYFSSPSPPNQDGSHHPGSTKSSPVAVVTDHQYQGAVPESNTSPTTAIHPTDLALTTSDEVLNSCAQNQLAACNEQQERGSCKSMDESKQSIFSVLELDYSQTQNKPASQGVAPLLICLDEDSEEDIVQSDALSLSSLIKKETKPVEKLDDSFIKKEETNIWSSLFQ